MTVKNKYLTFPNYNCRLGSISVDFLEIVFCFLEKNRGGGARELRVEFSLILLLKESSCNVVVLVSSRKVIVDWSEVR